ncbi:YfhJ family protein [Listeria costaricensis]|uniref:YfhJ family protein n=1 Tax=Listeria costaricensis TaxID=2026604 RepID=UPI000C072C54|nr:YfhJ family protein [Listeria costaricensis]
MNRYIEELTALLLEKNPALSEEQALLWIESLWSDFESSYAKAGYPYRGEEYAYDYVKKQIAIHGDKLHHLEPKKKSEDKK